MLKNKDGKKKSSSQRGKKSVTFVPCECKPKKTKKRKRRKNLKIHGTARDPKLGSNPYLNYFRQFYSKRGGRVIEAAKEAGANWRKMGSDEKAKYRNEQKKKMPKLYHSRIRKLNKIFRLLTPKSTSTPVKGEKIVKVRKILEDWTRKIYMEVCAGTNGNKKSNGSASKSVGTYPPPKANGKIVVANGKNGNGAMNGKINGNGNGKNGNGNGNGKNGDDKPIGNGKIGNGSSNGNGKGNGTT